MPGVKGRSGGHNRKPTRLKELAGTLRPDRANPDEPTPEILVKAPPCPTHIVGDARKEWRKRSRILVEMGVLSRADLVALEVYCTIYARWLAAQARLDQYGMVIGHQPKLDSDGNVVQEAWFEPSPFLRIVDESVKQMRVYLSEFGMTPSSRGRVKAVKPPVSGDGIDEYLFGKN